MELENLKNPARPTILVTGARGYIGGRLIRKLSESHENVIGSSRNRSPLPEGWPESVPLRQINPLQPGANDEETLTGVDVVVHLAAADEQRSLSLPDAALMETGAATRRLIEACITQGVRRFIFLSTIHVYGAPLLGQLLESGACSPSHPYAISHQIGEAFTLAAASAGRIEGIVVRLSNAIGAPAWMSVDRWSLVGNDLARQAIETGAINVKTPYHWRDFIAMSDVCDGLHTLTTSAALASGIYNLASGCALQVADIAERTATAAAEICRRKIEFNQPKRCIDPQAPPFEIGISRLRAIGFRPSGLEALDREIRDTIRMIGRARAVHLGTSGSSWPSTPDN